MILQPASVYQDFGNQPGIVWVLKEGVFQNGYTSSDFTFVTASSYVANQYLQISHNNAGRINFNFTPPRKYMYIKVQSYQNTTNTVYTLQPEINGTVPSSNRWIAINGTYQGLTPALCASPISVRANGAFTSSVAITSYFGGYHITDVWFTDYTDSWMYSS